MTTEIIVFYILGVIIAYPISKYLYLKQSSTMKWSQFDRILNIVMSLFSWFCIATDLTMVVGYLLFKKYGHKKANW